MKNKLNKSTKILVYAAALAITFAGAAQAGDEKPKLFEPYSPKPSGPSPDGWEIVMLKGSSIESKTTLHNGREIKVNAPAYELIPIAGGVMLHEPGFDPTLGNAQKLTIGALITQYSESATEMQKNLDKTLTEMEKGLSAQPAKSTKTDPTQTKKDGNPTTSKK